jgi:hypothetical protein
MTINRDSLLGKIRALMSKTAENGCTEHEALASLDKARALMDAYEVTEADLQLTRSESAILRSEPPGSRDPHGIKQVLAVGVARFCDCQVWKSSNGVTFCGLSSDAQFATWLLDTLTAFVQAELARHLMGNIAPKGERRFLINGFVAGAGRRITERLTELCTKSETVVSGNGRALVLVKTQAVADKMKAAGIHLSNRRSSGKRMDAGSYQAGKSAGNRASFGRPISGNAAALRLT